MMRSLPVIIALDADSSGDLSAAEISHAAERLRTLDIDASGSLEPSELLPPPGERQRGNRQRDPAAIAARLMELDRNGDGELDSTELPMRLHQAAATLDLDDTRSLSREELEQGIANGSLNRDGGSGDGRPGGGMGGADPARFLRRIPVIAALDRNEDGRIDTAEIDGAARALATLDLDGDGMVAGSELRPSRRGRRF